MEEMIVVPVIKAAEWEMFIQVWGAAVVLLRSGLHFVGTRNIGS